MLISTGPTLISYVPALIPTHQRSFPTHQRSFLRTSAHSTSPTLISYTPTLIPTHQRSFPTCQRSFHHASAHSLPPTLIPYTPTLIPYHSQNKKSTHYSTKSIPVVGANYLSLYNINHVLRQSRFKTHSFMHKWVVKRQTAAMQSLTIYSFNCASI